MCLFYVFINVYLCVCVYVYLCIKCLEVLVEICFFEMLTYNYNTEVNGQHGLESCGVEVQSMVRSVLAVSDSDTSLPFNNFKKQLQTIGSEVAHRIPAKAVEASCARVCSQNTASERMLTNRFWWRCQVQQAVV